VFGLCLGFGKGRVGGGVVAIGRRILSFGGGGRGGLRAKATVDSPGRYRR